MQGTFQVLDVPCRIKANAHNTHAYPPKQIVTAHEMQGTFEVPDAPRQIKAYTHNTHTRTLAFTHTNPPNQTSFNGTQNAGHLPRV